MLLKERMLKGKEQLLKYRYILIVVLGIIIILLIILFGIIYKVNANNKQNVALNEEEQNNNDVMLVDMDTKNELKEETKQEQKQEQEQKKEEEKEKEKEEEASATGIIYLTFDDGPSSDTTPQILDILEQKKIKATFFVLHYSNQNEELIKREASLGETIGLHGYTHAYDQVYQSADTCMENFRKIQEQVYQTTGIKSNIVRFPGGSSNKISKKYCEGVMTDLTTRVVNEGFRYFDWNVDSDDAGKAKNSEQVYNNVVSSLKPNRNNVVLMHDFTKNEGTINALPSIIDYGINNGYVFRKITDDTPMVKHVVINN